MKSVAVEGQCLAGAHVPGMPGATPGAAMNNEAAGLNPDGPQPIGGPPVSITATVPKPVSFGPYSLMASLLDGRMSIRRQDADHQRTVAFVDSLDEWDRFVAAIEAGADEVAAVHAIDAGTA